jgi:hypothetical protein
MLYRLRLLVCRLVDLNLYHLLRHLKTQVLHLQVNIHLLRFRPSILLLIIQVAVRVLPRHYNPSLNKELHHDPSLNQSILTLTRRIAG